MSGYSDELVFQFAQDQHAVLITADLGVADARLLSAASHQGVILLRMPNEMSNARINDEFERFLPDLDLNDVTTPSL